MLGTGRSVVAVVDDALSEEVVRGLFDYTIARGAEFAHSRVLGADESAVPTVDPSFRRNSHLGGTSTVPTAVMDRIRELVPDAGDGLGIPAEALRSGIFEADITVTGSGGYFRPHVDNANPSVRNRSASFVLFFGKEPREFRGGELCIERERADDKIFMFDACVDGRLGRPEVAEIVEPVCNRLVVFESHRLHEVRPVECDSDAFSSSRFTVTGFVRTST